MERRKRARGEAKKTDFLENFGESDLHYNVEDRPPIGTMLFFGFQLALANVCLFIMMTLLIQDLICADTSFATRLFSTITFMCGVSTIIQSYFGVRLPILQGSSLVWFLPYADVKEDPRWGCQQNTSVAPNIMNGTNITDVVMDNGPGWEAEWAKIAGSLMLAQCVQMLLGATGLVSLIDRVIRPITVCVFFILFGLYLEGIIADFSRQHWPISAMSIIMVVVFSQYIHWIQFPLPTWSPKKGLTVTKMPVFELFPILLAVLITWAIVAIVTVAGGFTDDENDIEYQTRTDIHSKTIADAPVFIFPHPGQFFKELDFSAEYFVILLVPVIATILESMGDYCQHAITCCLPHPPAHAMNRGIFMEGFTGFFGALMGMGIATTSYSQISGIIRITKVGNRRVCAVSGIMLIILAVFGKVGAVFISIPRPVLAGPVFIAIALLVGGTFTNLSSVDLGKSRNQTTLGCALMIGIFVPFYIKDYPINTGSNIADRLISSIISTHYLLGGFIAAFLDNTLPGRADIKRKRNIGMPKREEATGTIELDEPDAKKKGKRLRTYDEMMRVYEPPFISKYTRRWKCTRFVPMLPNPYPDDYQETRPTSTHL